MRDRRPASGADAVPGLHPGADPGPDGRSFTLEVDGESFELRPGDFGGTNYTWLSGPNRGYGFGASPTTGWSLEQHRTTIHDFLAQIDQTTGYIGDD